MSGHDINTPRWWQGLKSDEDVLSQPRTIIQDERYPPPLKDIDVDLGGLYGTPVEWRLGTGEGEC